MQLDGDDWGRLIATPRLVQYLIEPPPNVQPPKPCVRLVLYLGFAKATQEMLQKIDKSRNPSYYQSAGLVNQLEYRIDQVALFIQSYDPQLRSMLLAQKLDSDSELHAIAHVYARIVVGSENDPNCDQILASLRQAGLDVPGTCR
jgi:hypothetical protein